MERQTEPELMNDPEQAQAYAQADFEEAHQGLIDHFQQRFPQQSPQQVLDLGCGAADIALRMARAYPECHILGIDGAEAMLMQGQHALQAADLTSRVQLKHCHLPHDQLPQRGFDTVISNSLLHHLADPLVLWRSIVDYGSAGARVLVMDLARPASRQHAEELVQRYAESEPEILRRDFYHSLLAAYEPDEVLAQLQATGLARLQLEVISDRHWLVWGRLE